MPLQARPAIEILTIERGFASAASSVPPIAKIRTRDVRIPIF